MIRLSSMVAIVVSTILLALTGAATIWSFDSIGNGTERLARLAALEQAVLTMKDVSGEYDSRFEGRAIAQWRAADGEARERVRQLGQSGLFDAGLQSEYIRRLVEMGAFFDRLREEVSAESVDRELELLFRGRINSNADAILGRADKIYRTVNEEIKRSEAITFFAVLFCISIAIANIWWFYFFVARPVVSAFGTLREEMSRIGAGDLEKPVNMARTGEIGELFRSVDNMRSSIKSLTADLESKRTEAEASGRAKTEFLANMSHELRTPLNAVIGYADLMRDAESFNISGERFKYYADAIGGSGRHLLSLINDVLDFSKIDSGKLPICPEIFDFRSEIENIHSAFRVQAEDRNVRFIVHSEGSPSLIESDQTRIRQVLYNLVGNAIKFTSDAEVRVSVNLENREGRQIWLSLIVEDEGIGIEADRLEIIFNPFEQADMSTSRRFGGTGLGLPISKRIVEALGGELKVTSVPGKGSTFTASFPVQDFSDIAEATRAKLSLLPVSRSLDFGLHVLVVDDVALNREIAGELLTQFGCTFEEAHNGAEAVEKVRSGQFDLIMLDVHMPIMDGIEAAKTIREIDAERGINSRIFAWTADVLQPASLIIGPKSWNGIILKPVAMEDLETVLATVVKENQGVGTAQRLSG